MKKITVGLVSLAAIVLFVILALLHHDKRPSSSDRGKEQTPINQDNLEKETTNRNESDNKVTETILYENKEFGFTLSLPNSWLNYQIISDTWEGIASDQDQNNVIENGPLLLIRHPAWTEEKPRQDIPIMIFTHEQWSSLEKEEFHIGAAPIGPTLLGQNNQYVFALPARYNFSFLDGYEEVENILENKPLQPTNVDN